MHEASLVAALFGVALLGGCGLNTGGLDFESTDTAQGDSGSGGRAPSGGTGSNGSAATSGSGGAAGHGGATVGAGPGGPGATTGGGPSACASAPPVIDGCYWEDVCPGAPLEDLAGSYTAAGWLASSMAMMERRYPAAACLIDLYKNDVGNYADTSSFGALSESMMTMVHEETHGYDYEHALWGDTFAYYIRCDLTLETPWIDGFPRSAILPHVQGGGTSLYDGTYLTGQQGTYGFVELLDEWNAYLNGMAAIGLVGDYVEAYGISGTDGAVAFAYYVELYLKVARAEHPETYAALTGAQAVKDLVRLQWNRMHFFLGLAEAHDNLSINAAQIKQNLYDPANLSELELYLGMPIAADACN